MKFAFFLHTKGDILSWKNHIADADSILRLEYDNLDDVSKLIFLDLAIFAHEMSFTHMDFHDELDWVEHDNSKLVVDFIAMLHGISPYVAKSKVGAYNPQTFGGTNIFIPSMCLFYLIISIQVLSVRFRRSQHDMKCGT